MSDSKRFFAAHTKTATRGNGGWGGKPTRSTITVAVEPGAGIMSKLTATNLVLKAPAALVCIGLGAALVLTVRSSPLSYDSTSIVTL